MPAELTRLATLAILGDLGQLAPNWRSWILRGGRLHSPDYSGEGFKPGEVNAIPLLHARIADLEHRIRELTAVPFDVQLSRTIRSVTPVADPDLEPEHVTDTDPEEKDDEEPPNKDAQ